MLCLDHVFVVLDGASVVDCLHCCSPVQSHDVCAPAPRMVIDVGCIIYFISFSFSPPLYSLSLLFSEIFKKIFDIRQFQLTFTFSTTNYHHGLRCFFFRRQQHPVRKR